MAIKRIDSIFDVPSIKAEKEEVSKALVDVYGNIVNLFDAIQKSKGSTTFAEVSKDAKKLDDAMKATAASTTKLEIAQSNLGQKLAEEKVLLQQLNKENKNRATLNLTNAGSISRLEAVVVKLRASQKALNLETEEGQKKNAKYIKSIDFLNEKIKASSDSATKQRLNVGNYQGSAKIIVDALEKEKKKLEELEKTRIRVQNAGSSFNPAASSSSQINRTEITGFAGNRNTAGFTGITQSANIANKSVEELDKEIAQSRTIIEGFGRITDNPKFLNIAGKVGDAQAELKFFTKSLIDLERQGLGSSEAANTLRKNLAELTDQIGDAKAEVKALSSDTRGFDLFAGSVSFAADAFQTFAGAAVLAGASEEDAAEATKTLVAVQSVANGVKGIANELTTRGTAANIVYAGVQKIVATATDTSAASTVRLAAATKLLLGGAILGGIAFLVVKFIELRKAASEASKQQELLADINKEVAKSAGEEIAKLQTLYSVATNTNLSIKERKKAVDELQDQYPEYFKNINDELILQGKAADAYDKTKLAILETAKTRAIESKLAELANSDLEIQLNREGVLKNKAEAENQARLNRIKKANDEARGIPSTVTVEQDLAGGQAVNAINETLVESNKKLEENAKTRQFLLGQITTAVPFKEDKSADSKLKKSADDRLKAELDLEKRNYAAVKQLLIDEANEKIRIAQQTVDDQNATLKDQLAAIEEISQQKKNIAAIELADELKADKEVKDGKIITIKKTNAEIETANQEHGNKVAAINDETLKTMSKAEADYTQRIKDENEKRAELALKAVMDAGQKQRDLDEKNNNNAIIALNNRYETGEIKLKDYNKLREDLETDYQVRSLQREISYQKKIIALSTIAAEQKAEALRQLSQLELQLSDVSLKKKSENDTEELRRSQALTDLKKELAQSFFDFTTGLVQAEFENQLNTLAEKKKLDDDNYNREVENINNSTLNEQQKDEELKKIAKAKEVRDIAFDQKQKDIKLKQAKFDKAQAAFQVVINTAQAISKAVAEFPLTGGMPFAAIAAAIGAVQLAAILARPLPKYAHGLEDNPKAHLGIYGEAGPELVEKPGHQPFIANTPTVDFLPVGTNITPLAGDELNKIMYNHMLVSMANSLQLAQRERKEQNKIVTALDKQTRILSAAFRKQKPVVTNKIKVDLGWDRYLRDQVYY